MAYHFLQPGTIAIHDANIADLQAKYADIATIAEATARFAGS